jgi:hypothetical protein
MSNTKTGCHCEFFVKTILCLLVWVAQILCGADMFEKLGVSYTYGNGNAVGYEKICIML